MSNSLLTLANAIKAELDLHLIDDALANLPSRLTQAEKDAIKADTDAKTTNFSLSLARSIMKCMVTNAGQYPALYCSLPGITTITDFNQIGISKVTMVGGQS